jgi:predicted DNA repair protein MutK
MNARQLLVLLIGVLVLVATATAGQSDLLVRVLEPPVWAAVPLAIAACLVGSVMVSKAVERLRSSTSDPRSLIRGVRLVFLAVAAFAAAVGWLLGSAMPIVVGLVIGAVDVVETTLLLLVTRPAESPSE